MMRSQKQLAQLESGLQAAHARFHRLVAAAPEPTWALRVDPNAWSIAECIAHLNLTATAMIPLIRVAMVEAGRLGAVGDRAYRRSPIGMMLSAIVGPLPGWRNTRFGRVKTPPGFVPTGEEPRQRIVSDFDRLQEEQLLLVRECRGVAIDRVKIESPFAKGVRYDAYSALVMLPRHEHRHLAQAERVLTLATVGRPTGT